MCGAGGIQCPSLACDIPFSRQFIEETLLSLVYVLGNSVITSLITYLWVYSWTVYSIPLALESPFVPSLHCLLTVDLH